MVGIAALALLGAFQAPVQIMGKDVSLALPADLALDPSPEVLNWAGWKGLGGSGVTVFPKYCCVDKGLSDYVKGLGAPVAADAPAWRIRVFISRRWESAAAREALSDDNSRHLLQALAIAKLEIQKETGLQVSIEATNDAPTMDERDRGALARLAVLTRVNRGAFEADDKKFRGPYQSTLFLGIGWLGGIDPPAYSLGPTEESISVAPYGDQRLGSPLSTLVNTILFSEGSAAGVLLERQGIKPGENPLKTLASLNRAQQMQVLEGAPTQLADHPSAAPKTHIGVGAAATTEDIHLKLVDDSERGSVLQVSSAGDAYRSGVAFASLPATNSPRMVSFWARHISGGIDNFATGTYSQHGAPSANLEVRYALPSDSSWHHCVVTLAAGSGDLWLTHSGFLGLSRDEPVYEFADFAVGEAAPADAEKLSVVPLAPETLPSLGSPEPDPTTPDGQASIKLILSSGDAAHKLACLALLTAHPAPGLEAAIGGVIDDLDDRISDAAALALEAQKSDTGWIVLRKAFDHGVTEHEKAAAGLALASRKNASFLGPLSTLMVARDYEVRILTARAIHENGGPLEQTLLAGFIDQAEPEVRYTVVGFLDPSNDASAKKLLFASVNDPSDAVRELACERLLEVPAYLKDGQRGVQDDSRWVKVRLLQRLDALKRKEDRLALSQAVTSTDLEVRLAALRAFLDSPDPVDAAEIGPAALKDTNPEVQALIQQLVAKKGLKLT